MVNEIYKIKSFKKNCGKEKPTISSTISLSHLKNHQLLSPLPSLHLILLGKDPHIYFMIVEMIEEER